MAASKPPTPPLLAAMRSGTPLRVRTTACAIVTNRLHRQAAHAASPAYFFFFGASTMTI
jgi:hypothetical protein